VRSDKLADEANRDSASAAGKGSVKVKRQPLHVGACQKLLQIVMKQKSDSLPLLFLGFYQFYRQRLELPCPSFRKGGSLRHLLHQGFI